MLLFQLLIENIRKNHPDMVIAPKIQFDDENSIQNSRIQYQQLHLRDLWQRVQMPQEIKEYISTNESFSVSGRGNSRRGGALYMRN